MSNLIYDRLSDEVDLRGRRVELMSDVRESARPWTRDTALPGLFRARPDVAGTTVECIVDQFKNTVVVAGPDADRGLSGVVECTDTRDLSASRRVTPACPARWANIPDTGL